MAAEMTVEAFLPGIAPAAAFASFADSIGEWWPAETRHIRDADSRVALLAGGRFFERATDGRELELGWVREWHPPERMLLDLYIATGRERPTEVAILFGAVEGGTRIRIQQVPKAASAPMWLEFAPRFERAWTRVLKAFCDFSTGAKSQLAEPAAVVRPQR